MSHLPADAHRRLNNNPKPTLVEASNPFALINAWAKDEHIQFVSRSDGQRTTTTVSRDALLLLVQRARNTK